MLGLAATLETYSVDDKWTSEFAVNGLNVHSIEVAGGGHVLLQSQPEGAGPDERKRRHPYDAHQSRQRGSAGASGRYPGARGGQQSRNSEVGATPRVHRQMGFAGFEAIQSLGGRSSHRRSVNSTVQPKPVPIAAAHQPPQRAGLSQYVHGGMFESVVLSDAREDARIQ